MLYILPATCTVSTGTKVESAKGSDITPTTMSPEVVAAFIFAQNDSCRVLIGCNAVLIGGKTVIIQSA